MSGELGYDSAANSGDTLYVTVQNEFNKVWNGTAYEGPVDANYATYKVAIEEAENTGKFIGNMPTGAASAGICNFTVRKQAGGSPAVGDIVLGGSLSFVWDGSAVVSLASIKAKTDLLSTGSVTVVSPVTASGDINLTQGDDYSNDESRSLPFSNEDGTWGGSDLSSATILFTLRRLRDEVSIISKAGSVITPTGTQLVRVELEDTETKLLEIGGSGNYAFQVQATLPNESHVETIWEGGVNVTVEFD